jgi:crotonobetainyl-CoA:carnitine CoA-transferase CaiB-like acyl-CoA transferase
VPARSEANKYLCVQDMNAVGQTPTGGRRPLDGVRVLELGQLIAGPFAGTVLGYFGAEVIKVEPPAGDPLRGWRMADNATSVWWRSLARNNTCVTIVLRCPEGRALVARLVSLSDVLIESFRPGTMEKWGLGPDTLQSLNPNLVYARVSGYGQDGPYASLPGYASVCEGVGGFRYVTGFPDMPPVRPNLSLGDSLTGVHAALGILLALYEQRTSTTGAGQVVDIAIYEAVFNMMEAVIPEYDYGGVVRERSGTTVTGIAPSNIYLCRDGKYIIIGGNGDSIFRRLMNTANRPDLADDPRFATNAERVSYQGELDAAISAWTAMMDASKAVELLAAAAVPAAPIYSAADMIADPHFAARRMFEQVSIGGHTLKLPAIVPKLARTPGRTEWPGPSLGAHNREVLGGLLGLDDVDLERLEKEGVVSRQADGGQSAV